MFLLFEKVNTNVVSSVKSKGLGEDPNCQPKPSTKDSEWQPCKTPHAPCRVSSRPQGNKIALRGLAGVKDDSDSSRWHVGQTRLWHR